MITLLVVDDEKGLAETVRNFFRNRGFTIEAVNSGEEALDSIKKKRPDIVLLDIRMKGINGLDTLEKIKKIDNSIKVIMVTVMDEKAIIDKARELGADEYITKPFMMDYLEEVVIKKVQEIMNEKGEP